jgi:hypothetical protein
MRPLSFEKRALLRGSLRSFGNYAARNPDDALALTHAIDQAAKGGLKGALIGGAGGYAIAPEGEEEDMALRGALLGGGLNALRTGALAGDELSDALRDPRVRARMSGRLRDLQSGGALLGRAMGA